jgi:hypothetical protein
MHVNTPLAEKSKNIEHPTPNPAEAGNEPAASNNNQ